MMPTQYTQRPQRGTTLVEVLIAALIIGIGLLGIASLQVKALQASTNAESRAIATDIAASLADRIRANLINKADYVNETATENNCSMVPGSSAAVSSGSCNTNSDTPATTRKMAQDDLYAIQNSDYLGLSKLPGGDLTITCDPTACDTDDAKMRITVSWQVRNDVLGNTDGSGNSIDFISVEFIPGADDGAP
ncbi:type IV pilus modification protein PilV [Thiolapillus sp.]